MNDWPSILLPSSRAAAWHESRRMWGPVAVAHMVILATLAAASPAGAAEGGNSSGIYSCVDASGKRYTSDRPIPECLDREQRLLNKDGSQRKTVPPRMNAEERAAMEERDRQRERERAAAKDAVRRDRNLMLRFPDQATHDKAREAALDDVRRGVNGSDRQLRALREERKHLIA